MEYIVYSCIGVGFFGMSAMTWLFPLCASLFYTRKNKSFQSTSTPHQLPERLAVIIPVHDDTDGLVQTLKSIEANREDLRHWGARCTIDIYVGIDGHSEGAVAGAAPFGATCIVSEEQRGKWATLQDLVGQCATASWVACADAGILWPSSLVRELFAHNRRDIVCLAPGYRDNGTSALGNLTWHFEQTWKGLENMAGGPISLHGATIFFEEAALRSAFTLLSPGPWLNDDVVLPLALRAASSEATIKYVPSLSCHDALTTEPVAHDSFARRTRLVRGNLEWMSAPFWRTNLLVVLLAGRRIARVFWAYWILFFLVGLGGCLAGVLTIPILLGVIGALTLISIALVSAYALVSLGLRGISYAFAASLLAPLLLWQQGNPQTATSSSVVRWQ